MKIDLDVLAGPLKGKKFSFDQYKKISIGRSPEAFLSFPDDKRISRFHCLIEIAPPSSCHIRDLESTNGTFISQGQISDYSAYERVAEASIGNGSYVKIGHNIFRLSWIKESTSSLEKDETVAMLPPTLKIPPPNSTPSSNLEISPGRKLGPFEVISKLGEGGMGVVYLVKHHESGYLYAIKIARPQVEPNEDQVNRFLQEAECGAKVKHPNIVRYYRAKYAKGNFFYIPMEYVPGVNLNTFIRKRDDALTLEEARSFFLPFLDALEYLHGENIIHRDIKPSNILLTKQDEDYVVKLSDFGLAKSFESTGMSGLTLSHCMMGTPEFLAPEQCVNAKYVDFRADIYSAGATFYNLLTKKRIFDEEGPIHIYSKIMLEYPPRIESLRADLPSPLSDIIMGCLEKEANNRPQTVVELRKTLDSILP